MSEIIGVAPNPDKCTKESMERAKEQMGRYVRLISPFLNPPQKQGYETIANYGRIGR